MNLLCFNGKVLKIYVSRDQIPVLRTGSRPIAMVLVECWKVAHWTAKKLLTNCHLDFLICSYYDNQKLYFSFFTINANIGREKGGNLAINSCLQIWGKYVNSHKSNGAKHMVHLTSFRTILGNLNATTSSYCILSVLLKFFMKSLSFFFLNLPASLLKYYSEKQ